LKVVVQLLAVSKAFPISVKADLRLEAAETINFCAAPLAGVVALPAAVVVVAPLSEVQAAMVRTSMVSSTTTASTRGAGEFRDDLQLIDNSFIIRPSGPRVILHRV